MKRWVEKRRRPQARLAAAHTGAKEAEATSAAALQARALELDRLQAKLGDQQQARFDPLSFTLQLYYLQMHNYDTAWPKQDMAKAEERMQQQAGELVAAVKALEVHMLLQ